MEIGPQGFLSSSLLSGTSVKTRAISWALFLWGMYYPFKLMSCQSILARMLLRDFRALAVPPTQPKPDTLPLAISILQALQTVVHTRELGFL